jgi:hypothetical protein
MLATESVRPRLLVLTDDGAPPLVGYGRVVYSIR